jgi:hypothetical protein
MAEATRLQIGAGKSGKIGAYKFDNQESGSIAGKRKEQLYKFICLFHVQACADFLLLPSTQQQGRGL